MEARAHLEATRAEEKLAALRQRHVRMWRTGEGLQDMPVSDRPCDESALAGVREKVLALARET